MNSNLPKLFNPTRLPWSWHQQNIDPVLKMIYKSSMDCSVFPVDHRSYHAVLLFGKGDCTNTANHELISLTAVEHTLHKSVMLHLDRHNIQTGVQHGFHRRNTVDSKTRQRLWSRKTSRYGDARLLQCVWQSPSSKTTPETSLPRNSDNTLRRYKSFLTNRKQASNHHWWMNKAGVLSGVLQGIKRLTRPCSLNALICWMGHIPEDKHHPRQPVFSRGSFTSAHI